MDKKIKLLETLRDMALDMARYNKACGKVQEWRSEMGRVQAYQSAIYILKDKDYFESLCQIWNIE